MFKHGSVYFEHSRFLANFYFLTTEGQSTLLEMYYCDTFLIVIEPISQRYLKDRMWNIGQKKKSPKVDYGLSENRKI